MDPVTQSADIPSTEPTEGPNLKFVGRPSQSVAQKWQTMKEMERQRQKELEKKKLSAKEQVKQLTSGKVQENGATQEEESDEPPRRLSVQDRVQAMLQQQQDERTTRVPRNPGTVSQNPFKTEPASAKARTRPLDGPKLREKDPPASGGAATASSGTIEVIPKEGQREWAMNQYLEKAAQQNSDAAEKGSEPQGEAKEVVKTERQKALAIARWLEDNSRKSQAKRESSKGVARQSTGLSLSQRAALFKKNAGIEEAEEAAAQQKAAEAAAAKQKAAEEEAAAEALRQEAAAAAAAAKRKSEVATHANEKEAETAPPDQKAAASQKEAEAAAADQKAAGSQEPAEAAAADQRASAEVAGSHKEADGAVANQKAAASHKEAEGAATADQKAAEAAAASKKEAEPAAATDVTAEDAREEVLAEKTAAVVEKDAVVAQELTDVEPAIEKQAAVEASVELDSPDPSAEPKVDTPEQKSAPLKVSIPEEEEEEDFAKDSHSSAPPDTPKMIPSWAVGSGSQDDLVGSGKVGESAPYRPDIWDEKSTEELLRQVEQAILDAEQQALKNARQKKVLESAAAFASTVSPIARFIGFSNLSNMFSSKPARIAASGYEDDPYEDDDLGLNELVNNIAASISSVVSKFTRTAKAPKGAVPIVDY